MEEEGEFLNFGSDFGTVGLLIGIAIVLGCLSVLTLGLSFCLSSNIVFMACGWLMSGSGLVMGLACALFPTAWGNENIAAVCQSASYDSGLCGIGKSYVLAGITACDSVVMAVLAFILAYRQVTLLPWADEDDEESATETRNKT